MKTLIAILTAGSVLGLGAQQARADGGWATTGKILTGLVIGSAIARAVEPPPTVVYAPAPVVYTYQPAPAVTYAPAPTVAPAPVVSAAPVAAPAPVYYVQPAPAPVVVYAAPVYRPYYYCAPSYYCAPPLVSFRFGIGGGHYRHGRW